MMVQYRGFLAKNWALAENRYVHGRGRMDDGSTRQTSWSHKCCVQRPSVEPVKVGQARRGEATIDGLVADHFSSRAKIYGLLA